MKTLIAVLLSWCWLASAQPQVISIYVQPPLVWLWGDQLPNTVATFEASYNLEFTVKYDAASYGCYPLRQTVVASAPFGLPSYFRMRNSDCSNFAPAQEHRSKSPVLYFHEGQWWNLYEIVPLSPIQTEIRRYIAEPFLQL
jgi:hypothetical protein